MRVSIMTMIIVISELVLSYCITIVIFFSSKIKLIKMNFLFDTFSPSDEEHLFP